MTNFASDKLQVKKPAAEIFSFLNDFRNFEMLMPEQITNWQATEKNCSFTVQGMANIGMVIHDSEPNSKIHIKSDGKVPFNFDMYSHLKAIDENLTEVSIDLEADVNSMLLMMVKRPLQNLVNIMVEKLKIHQENLD
jgi:carbon monoxide dehydrogenase subunit G